MKQEKILIQQEIEELKIQREQLHTEAVTNTSQLTITNQIPF